MNLAELANVDDLDKQWPTTELLETLSFPTIVVNVFNRQGNFNKETLSLAEVFEMVISSDEDPRPGYLISRMLDYRCIGKKSLFIMISRLTEIDVGERCNSAWQQKYDRFLKSHRMKGSHSHSWSFPITKEGEQYAMFRSGGLTSPRRRKRTN